MFAIWRPSIPESADGLPLATEISHLFADFPYERLPEDQFVATFLRPECMLALLVFYLTTKPIFKFASSLVDPKATWFRASIAIHNFALAIFSAVVAYNSWPIVFSHLYNNDPFETYCDKNGTLWNEGGLGAWAVVFYISKFYEFIDTWILVLKGKNASFLQVYHHTGIAFCMWGGVLSQSSWLIYVVLFNSVIHTLMYTYFLIKTISPTTEIKAAKNLTMMQIGQFFSGIACSSGTLIMGEKCDTQSSRFMLACLDTYGFGLIFLFVTFAARKYKKK